MSITDSAAQLIKSFKPIDVKTNIKNPVINYQSPTNIFQVNEIKLDDSQLDLIIKGVTSKLTELCKRLPKPEENTRP